MNTVGARKEFKRKRIYDDNYFIREKGGRSRGSIVYQRENVERRSGGEGSQGTNSILAIEIHVISTSTSIAVVIFFIQ